MRLIDADALADALYDKRKNYPQWVADVIGEMPTIDTDAMLKEQEAKWIHREDMDFIDKYNCNHFHGMCTNCGLVHDFIDGHTGQYLYCPRCGRTVKWN